MAGSGSPRRIWDAERGCRDATVLRSSGELPCRGRLGLQCAPRSRRGAHTPAKRVGWQAHHLSPPPAPERNRSGLIRSSPSGGAHAPSGVRAFLHLPRCWHLVRPCRAVGHQLRKRRGVSDVVGRITTAHRVLLCGCRWAVSTRLQARRGFQGRGRAAVVHPMAVTRASVKP